MGRSLGARAVNRQIIIRDRSVARYLPSPPSSPLSRARYSASDLRQRDRSGWKFNSPEDARVSRDRAECAKSRNWILKGPVCKRAGVCVVALVARRHAQVRLIACSMMHDNDASHARCTPPPPLFPPPNARIACQDGISARNISRGLISGRTRPQSAFDLVSHSSATCEYHRNVLHTRDLWFCSDIKK